VIGRHTAGTGADRSKAARRPAEYNRPVDRYEYPDDEARGTRSSSATPSSGRAGVQVHEPEGGFGTSSGVCWSPGAVGLLLAKFKGLALVLLKVKFLGTAMTMLVSTGAYALLFPLWFAVGIVALLWVQRKC
jgi:hypothetical protein